MKSNVLMESNLDIFACFFALSTSGFHAEISKKWMS